MAAIALPPSRDSSSRCVRIDLWNGGWGRVVRGADGHERARTEPLPTPVTVELLDALASGFPDCFEHDEREAAKWPIFDGAPAKLDVFRRAPFDARSFFVNLSAAPTDPIHAPLFHTCERLWQLAAPPSA